MGICIDLVGQKFNRLLVIEKTTQRKAGSVVWKCLCDCGNFYFVTSSDLKLGRVKSCGCLKKETDHTAKGNVKDLLGQQFGQLKVIARDGSDKRGEAKWLCQCSCGSNPISVLGSNLRSGHTQSCGCDRASHGEKAIVDLLVKNQIPFIKEYKFDDLPKLRFDFYITDKQYLIEYDGETHYQYNLHGWHDEGQYLAQQERDSIKDDYCKQNHIPLIRIPYWHLSKLTINDLKLDTTTFIINKE